MKKVSIRKINLGGRGGNGGYGIRKPGRLGLHSLRQGLHLSKESLYAADSVSTHATEYQGSVQSLFVSTPLETFRPSAWMLQSCVKFYAVLSNIVLILNCCFTRSLLSRERVFCAFHRKSERHPALLHTAKVLDLLSPPKGLQCMEGCPVFVPP